MKIAKLIGKEQSKDCPWMVHWTLMYRGKALTFTTNDHSMVNQYEVGQMYIVETYKARNGCTNIYILRKKGA